MRSWQKVCAQPVPANSGGEDICVKIQPVHCGHARSVAVLVLDELAVFEFGVCARSSASTAPTTGSRPSTSASAACEPGEPVTTTGRVQVVPEYGLDGLRGADLVAVPATGLREFPDEVLQALRDAPPRGPRC